MEKNNFTETMTNSQRVIPQHTEPLHQYAVGYNQTPLSVPIVANANFAPAMNVGIMGFIVVSTGTMGANLHRVGEGEMTMGQALNSSVVRGTVGGVAAAAATVAATTLTNGGLAGLAVTLAAATGVSYLLSR
ncbi:MAG: hypothetical protein ACK5PS_19865 [Desulfopila sp.]